MKLRFSIVVAATQKGGIGCKGALPWPKISEDLSYFRDLTTKAAEGKKNAVIMGRRTWESLPSLYRPLPHRINIVLTSRPETLEGDVFSAEGLDEALDRAASLSDSEVDRIFVIGGGQVFRDAIRSSQCERIYLAQILKDYPFDIAFPPIPPDVFALDSVGEVRISGGGHSIPFQFNVYQRKTNLGERGYLRLVQEILDHGKKRQDRTGVGTLSIFGAHLRFNLQGGEFPILTTKKVFFRGVIEELLWMIRGSTDANDLKKKNIHIWDGNSSRSFLDQAGFPEREEGDLGPVYGFQWRHFGAVYQDYKTDYKGEGVDQLVNVIEMIKKDPDSRRIVMCSWNPVDIPKMALPPCHCLAQFYVQKGKLSCQLYQRSADMGIGVPFNIASYAALTYLIAHLTHLEPSEFIHTIGDAHLYLNHIGPLKEQLRREPKPFPTLRIRSNAKELEKIEYSDFELMEYEPYDSIQMKMAV